MGPELAPEAKVKEERVTNPAIIEALEDDPDVEPQDLPWPVPKYWRVCVNGHLVTDRFNSYEVSRGKDGTSYACKRCQLEANARLKAKKQGTVAGEPFEEIPDTPEHRAEIEAEHAPGPDETPQDLPPSLLALQAQLDRIERKVESIIADRPNVATRVFTERIRSLEEQLAEAKKGPGLDEMTFEQLKAKASELGIEIPKGLRSAGARKLIEAALPTAEEASPVVDLVETPAQDSVEEVEEVEEVDQSEEAEPEPEAEAEVEPEAEPEEEPEPEAEPEAEPEEDVPVLRRRRRSPKTEEEIDAAAAAAEERQVRRRRRPVSDES